MDRHLRVVHLRLVSRRLADRVAILIRLTSSAYHARVRTHHLILMREGVTGQDNCTGLLVMSTASNHRHLLLLEYLKVFFMILLHPLYVLILVV